LFIQRPEDDLPAAFIAGIGVGLAVVRLPLFPEFDFDSHLHLCPLLFTVFHFPDIFDRVAVFIVGDLFSLLDHGTGWRRLKFDIIVNLTGTAGSGGSFRGCALQGSGTNQGEPYHIP